MPAVHFPAHPVYDPHTGQPLLEARGAIGNIVLKGTSTPATLSEDEAGLIPIEQPVMITPGGHVPRHWNQDGLHEATFVPLSGTWSTDLVSPQGYVDAARAAWALVQEGVARAELAEQAAREAAAGVGAPTDEAFAGLLDSVSSQARAAAVRLIEANAVVDPTPWGEIPQQPTAGVFTSSDDIELVEDVAAGTASFRGAGRLSAESLGASFIPAGVLLGPGIDITGTTESTAAVQAVFDAGGDIFATGTLMLNSISITKSVRVTAPGARFVRAAGADAASGSYWNPGAAMFEVDAAGLSVKFDGPFTYDGNAQQQTATEPTGFFLKTYPTAGMTSDPTTVHINEGMFTNGTSGYLLLRGDDAPRVYETRVVVDDCTFTDTIYGIGKGDPATPNTLGYEPNYIVVMDYVSLIAKNLRGEWHKPTGTGQYAACLIKGTYFGTDFNTSGEPSVYLHGRTFVRGMGRSAKKWDNDADWVTNNGIGAIDMYGNADTVFVENLLAVDCENVTVRAKASVKRFTVLAATLVNCHRGLQVSVSSTGSSETVVKVGTLNTEGGTIPQLEFTGSTATDDLPAVSVDSVSIKGTLANPEALTLEGAVHLRNVKMANLHSVSIDDAPGRGVSVIDADVATITGVRIDGTGAQGVYVSGGGMFDLAHFDITNTGGEGVSVAGATRNVSISHGRCSGVTNNGVFSNNTSADVLITDVAVDTVSGTGRGFYAGSGSTVLIGNTTGAGVAIPLGAHGSARKREEHNSWNPAQFWSAATTLTGTSGAIPTAGTWQVGDKVLFVNAGTLGFEGAVCTVAGSPGTWKTFGAVSA